MFIYIGLTFISVCFLDEKCVKYLSENLLAFRDTMFLMFTIIDIDNNDLEAEVPQKLLLVIYPK